MSPRTAASSADVSGGAKTAAAVAFVLLMAIVVLLLINARPAPEPLDPRSGRPDGARGLVVSLEAVGFDVAIERSAPARGGAGRALVLVDALNDEQRADLLDFVEAGGVAVVADPTSTLHGGADVDGGARQIELGSSGLPPIRLDAEFEANLAPGECTIDALTKLRGLVVPDGLLFPVGPNEPRCFTGPAPASGVGSATSFVVIRSVGAGTIVGLGDNELFQNRWLRGADNAGLAASLLADPGGGSGPGAITILLGAGSSPTVEDIGSGDDSLTDLVPAWVWMLMVLGALSFVVFAVSRATRLGRVLVEPEVTPFAGSELVSATGNLMERAGHAQRAGQVLQQQLHRELCAAYGVSPTAPWTDLDRVIAERAVTSPGQVAAALTAQVSTDDALVRAAGGIGAIRRRALDPSRRNTEAEAGQTVSNETVPFQEEVLT